MGIESNGTFAGVAPFFMERFAAAGIFRDPVCPACSLGSANFSKKEGM